MRDIPPTRPISAATKQAILDVIVERLRRLPEVRRIVIFGSFRVSPNPSDLDLAIFQDSNDPYLSLALKYRQILDDIAAVIALDIIPLRDAQPVGLFMSEIHKGEVIYAAA